MHQYASEGEWLAARKPTVSSTESPALFGMSPYMTAYELAISKTAALQAPVNERMRWGQRLQDSVAQGIADDYGVSIESLGLCYAIHENEPRMGASFDYRIVGAAANAPKNALVALYDEFGPGLLEIKTVDWLQFRDWPLPDAPDHIEIQIQHQLEVSGLEWAALGVLVGGNRAEVYTRRRDRDVGDSMRQRIHEFWANLDEGILPPPVMPEDAALIIKLHQYADPGKVLEAQDDTVLATLCNDYVGYVEAIKKLDEAKKTTQAQLLQRIGTAERILIDGYSFTTPMIAPALVKEHTRGGYRGFKLTRKKEKPT